MLLYAVKSNDVLRVRELLEGGADLNAARDGFRFRHAACVRLLVA